MTFSALDFLERHGVVLAAGRGAVPSVANEIAGEPIKGSWWGHAKGKQIFVALNVLADSDDVLSFKLLDGKVTFVHRRLWPALVKLAREIGVKRLTVIRQEHTETGAHRNVTTAFPKWVTKEMQQAADRLDEASAREQVNVLLKEKGRVSASGKGKRPGR